MELICYFFYSNSIIYKHCKRKKSRYFCAFKDKSSFLCYYYGRENHYVFIGLLDPIFIDACDADFDGYAIFDLTSVTNDILNGLSGVTLTFHESYPDAFANTNLITDPTVYANIIANEQTIYVRVEDDATGCFIIREIEIHTNLLLTETVTDEFSQCDIDNDGIEAFNLSEIALEIINGIPLLN